MRDFVAASMISIYTDGAYNWGKKTGGWAAIILQDGGKTPLSGRVEKTTSNRMEILAAIKGLEKTPEGADVTIYSDSQYLVFTMTRGWKRNKNLDLWNDLDRLVSSRNVQWEWIAGHAGHPENEEADRLANEQAGISSDAPSKQLTHVDSQGRARMVDITRKADTEREAIARGTVLMDASTLELINKGQMEKGDVLAVAKVAGIMAAKETHRLIPLCHPLPLTHVGVDFDLKDEPVSIEITATARTTAKTGVEMEALSAVAVSALTIYDMCKAVDRGMRITDIRLVRKSGGRSGTIELE
ncbi:MAG: cyclic pyranopterin monophosphate synthase MoaC [Chloroflexi bacterium]|nr:cyclic pyranopterin monophosphate synthase MoaC [Chloroflexota bacterium]